MVKIVDHLYILLVILFTVYGQLILKWRVNSYDLIPTDGLSKLKFVFSLLLDPYVISSFVAAFAASLVWMIAMTKFELNYAYPFMSLNFALVILLSTWLLAEPLSLQRLAGVALIMVGTAIAAGG